MSESLFQSAGHSLVVAQGAGAHFFSLRHTQRAVQVNIFGQGLIFSAATNLCSASRHFPCMLKTSPVAARAVSGMPFSKKEEEASSLLIIHISPTLIPLYRGVSDGH